MKKSKSILFLVVFFVILVFSVIMVNQINANISNGQDYIIATQRMSYKIYENSVFLVFSFSDNISLDGEGIIHYGETNEYGMTERFTIKRSDTAGVEIKNLKPNTTYHYKLMFENQDLLGILDTESGWQSTKEYEINHTFITNGTDLDSINSKVTVLNQSSIYIDIQFISFNVNDAYTLEYTYYKGDIKQKDFSVDSNGYFRISLTDLKPGILYNYRFKKDQQSATKSGWLYSFLIEETKIVSDPIPAVKRLDLQVKNLNQNSQKLLGKILLEVEKNGEAWYLSPSSNKAYFLGRPDDAFQVMRQQGIGITNVNLEKIPIGLSNLSGQDSDGDGLPDMFEDAIGTDKNKKDTDGDGYDDKNEIEAGFDPTRGGGARLPIDLNFAEKQKGKIFLQVERNGEAWYVNPADGKRYFLGRPTDAFNVMRNLGLGISNNDFDKLK